MNPRERILAAIRGEEVDRVPLALHGFHFASLDGVTDAGQREIAGRISEQVDFGHGYCSFANRYLVTPSQRIRETHREERNGEVTTTTQIATPKGDLTAVRRQNTTSNTTWTVKYPVESLEDIDKIRSIPWELPDGLAVPDPSSLPPSFETRGIASTAVSSPVVCVAAMMPYGYFLELCATHYELIRELTALCLERIISLLDVLLSPKLIEYVWMGGCEWLTPPMGSPKLYETLVQEFERKVIERIHAGGALSHVHCHGNVRSTLEMTIQRGADYFEPVEPPPDGDITFAEAKAIANGRITLGGNVEARLLENEDADAVEEATRRAFEGGKRRMVLSTSANPISAISPKMVENYHRLIDVWEELSPI